jgi:Domain of unknown function (DUF4269)
MIDFKNPYYLKNGNPKQKKVCEIVEELQILSILKSYNPIIVGTIPIEIDLPESDIDIICETADLPKLEISLKKHFSDFDSFTTNTKTIRNKESLIVRFIYGKFDFEIFGQNTPTEQQYAYRHMFIEYQILQSRPNTFREKIILLKKQGYSTEEAFARLLNLSGEPYEALLNIIP